MSLKLVPTSAEGHEPVKDKKETSCPTTFSRKFQARSRRSSAKGPVALCINLGKLFSFHWQRPSCKERIRHTPQDRQNIDFVPFRLGLRIDSPFELQGGPIQ